MTDALFGVAIGSSIRAAVLAAAIALVFAVFRVRASGLRHGAWTAVLATMLLMPALSRLVPALAIGRRIGRVLFDSAGPEPSRARTVLVAAVCAAVMAGVIACTREAAVPPLREDPELAAVLKARKDSQELFRTARRLTSEEAAALEVGLAKNPDDKASREMLLAYYQWVGRKDQTRDARMAASRPHALWLIEHAPDTDLLRSGMVATDTGPASYAQARALWLTQVAKPDVSAATLGNAAAFFSESEPPLAERLLLRARALQPGGPEPRTYTDDISEWNMRLGMLYADLIVRDHPHAREVREALEESTDAELLHSTGFVLWVRSRRGGSAPDETFNELGRRYVERAAGLDSPAADEARRFLKNTDPSTREELPLMGTMTPPRESWADLLANATEAERLRRLTSFADQEYLRAEYLEWRARQPEGNAFRSKDPQGDKEQAAAAFARSKQYARQALELAPALRGTAEYSGGVFRAHIALGLNAFREADRETAVGHLLEASRVPSPPDAAFEPRSLLESRLVNYMLKHGERETIVEYLERAAAGRTIEQREQMREAAAAIRDGRMPKPYQVLLAGGHL